MQGYPAVTEETTRVSPKIVKLSNLVSAEPSALADGRTDMHLAYVIRIKDDEASTLLVNLYDELGRITNTTKGDISFDYEYDKDSRLIKKSKYQGGLYQGCYKHEYFDNSHNITAYSADGSIVYNGETYSEVVNENGELLVRVICINEKEQYVSILREYDRKTGRIISDYSSGIKDVKKDLRHSYELSERKKLVETVTDSSGKMISKTIYSGDKRSEDKILRYEEYDSNGNTIRGFENKYSEINGISVLEAKASMEMNSITGKIRADIYFYPASSIDIHDDIFEYLGMESTDFTRLTVHIVSSDHDDIAVTYGSSGTKMKTVTSNKDSNDRVVEIIEKDKNGKWVSVINFEYDAFGNCTKMTVKDGDGITEYIFGYISVPNSYCEPFDCSQAEEYIGK